MEHAGQGRSGGGHDPGSPFPKDRNPSATHWQAWKELVAILPLPGVHLECCHPGKLWQFCNRGFESFKWLLVRCYTDSFNLPK